MLDLETLGTTPGCVNAVLAEFTSWLNAGERTIRLWSMGPSFDAAILAAAYRAAGMAVPWVYRHERCVRTMLELADIDVGNYRKAGETSHDALTDALAQTRAIQEALRRLPVARLPLGEAEA